MLAIERSLYRVSMETSPQKTVILTDSLSSVMALENSSSKNNRLDIINSIRLVATNLANNGHEVVICWIPSHCGIKWNDVADRLANKGRAAENITTDCKLGRSEMKSLIKKRMRAIKWNNDWRNSRHGNFTKTIFPNAHVGIPKLHAKGNNDRITRLRLGNPIFLAARDLYCEECDTEKTIEHVLMRCQKHTAHRLELELEYMKQGIPFGLCNILRHKIKGSIRPFNKKYINKLVELI